jgi:hypothetical protein
MTRRCCYSFRYSDRPSFRRLNLPREAGHWPARTEMNTPLVASAKMNSDAGNQTPSSSLAHASVNRRQAIRLTWPGAARSFNRSGLIAFENMVEVLLEGHILFLFPLGPLFRPVARFTTSYLIGRKGRSVAGALARCPGYSIIRSSSMPV